jgi:hypothetical protein
MEFEDIHGNIVTVSGDKVIMALAKDGGNILFGMNFDAILELRKQYLYRHGTLTITKESIKAVYERPANVLP